MTSPERLRWIAEGLATQTVELEPVRSSDTSETHLVRSGDTRAYFKECRGLAAHEPALLAALADRSPGFGPDVIRVDTTRGWVLMADAGSQLRGHIRAEGDRTRSERMMRHYALAQQSTAPHVEELLALGVPDRRLSRLPALWADLIAEREWLMVGDERGVAEADLERIAALDVRALCERLASLNLPDTLNHDDFHTANVVVRDHQYRIVDWGESSITHPLVSGLIPLRDAKYILGYDDTWLDRIREAFISAWSDYATPGDLRAALPVAFRLATLSLALYSKDSLAMADAATRSAEGDRVPFWLMLCVNDTPLVA